MYTLLVCIVHGTPNTSIQIKLFNCDFPPKNAMLMWMCKGHFRQGSKEQGPMILSIPLSQELKIGPKVFSQGSKTKQIMI
jgi:hypothetical protein